MIKRKSQMISCIQLASLHLLFSLDCTHQSNEHINQNNHKNNTRKGKKSIYIIYRQLVSNLILRTISIEALEASQ